MNARAWSMALSAWTALAGLGLAAEVEDSVVKVFSNVRLPNIVQPWLKQGSQEATGTGVVIEGNRILTNAHVVSYASDVSVQPRQSDERFEARVVAYAPAVDLALLEVEDATLFENRPPLERATELPSIQAKVAAYGYPVGGSSLSVTQGIVSRIEYTSYSLASMGLRIQIDAAVNPGNSGGPALVDGKMIGLVFSMLAGGQNIGYIIPNEEIEMFLTDVADGKYDGKPRVLDVFQTLENQALRAKLGVDKKVKGMVVRAPAKRDEAYPLEEWDVVTHIGDYAIDNEAQVKLRENLRVAFYYVFPKIVKENSVPLTVLRGKETLQVTLPLGGNDQRVVSELRGRYPRWFLHGPLVFAPAYLEAISTYFQGNPGLSQRDTLLLQRRMDGQAFPGEELVVVTTPLLKHRITRGYGEVIGQVVGDVNGTPVKNLNHLVELLRDCQDEFVTIRFAETSSETLVFRNNELRASTTEIMSDFGIPRRGSDDVEATWNAKPAAGP